MTGCLIGARSSPLPLPAGWDAGALADVNEDFIGSCGWAQGRGRWRADADGLLP